MNKHCTTCAVFVQFLCHAGVSNIRYSYNKIQVSQCATGQKRGVGMPADRILEHQQQMPRKETTVHEFVHHHLHCEKNTSQVFGMTGAPCILRCGDAGRGLESKYYFGVA